jgi:hypothetical protein
MSHGHYLPKAMINIKQLVLSNAELASQSVKKYNIHRHRQYSKPSLLISTPLSG